MGSKKTLKIILSVILALILCIAIFFIAAPRTAMKLVMSDVNYAKYVVSKNVLRLYTKNDALKLEGRMSGSIGEIEFLDDDESVLALNKYLKTVLVSGEFYKGKEAAKLYMSASDADGVLLSGDAIFSEEVNCFRVNELNTGWLKAEKEKVKASTAASTANTSTPGIELEKLIKVSKDEIEIKATVNQLKNGIASDFLPDEYRDLFDSAIKSIVPKLSELGFENINIKFDVNGRNHITAMTALLTGAKDEIKLEITFDKKSEGTLTYNDLIFAFVTSETKLESFDVPSKMEVAPLDEDTLKSDLIKYLFGEAMDKHSDLKEMYTAVFGSKIKYGLGALLEGFVDTDKLAEGIQGIVDSAMNKDASGVDDILSNFFGAFGLADD